MELTQKDGKIDRGADNAARSRKALEDLTDSVQTKDREVMVHALIESMGQLVCKQNYDGILNSFQPYLRFCSLFKGGVYFVFSHPWPFSFIGSSFSSSNQMTKLVDFVQV